MKRLQIEPKSREKDEMTLHCPSCASVFKPDIWLYLGQFYCSQKCCDRARGVHR